MSQHIVSNLGGVLTSSSTTDTTASGNRTTVTNTTTVDRDGGTVLTDVNYIPKMRGLEIDFIGYSMRPTRQVYYYFDDIEMSHFIQRPNIIELDTQTSIRGFGDGRELAKIGVANALVQLNETSVDTSNTRIYLKHFINTTGAIETGNLVTGQTSGAIGNVVSYLHQSGVSRSGSNTTDILMALDANGATDDFYKGNVICLMDGQSSNIVAYNAASRIANVSPAFSAVSANIIYSIGDSRVQYASNVKQSHYTSESGFIVGTFHLPDPTQNTIYQFFTGDRIFRILDNPSNDLNDYTTKADYRFTSNGLEVSTQQIINRSVTTNVATTTIRVTPPVTRNREGGGGGDGAGGGGDPTAQQFFIPSDQYPEGMFVSSIDLFFKNKGTILPIEVQLRPMVNGIPDSYNVLPGATVIKQPSEINVSTNPDSANSATYTRFTFQSPVYLAPGLDYCFVVLTNSYEYDFFVSEQGQPDLRTGRIITKQPYIGSMFKSQNAVTYTPIQSENVMFTINKAKFEASGSVEFHEKKLDYYNGTGNTVFDLFQVHSDSAELPETTLTFNYKSTTNANTTLETSYNAFLADKDVLLNERKVVFNPAIPTESFIMKVDFATNNTDISPIMWRNRQNLVSVENIINNMGLTADSVSIANVGTGYANSTSALTFASPSGSGANGYIEVNGSGEITQVYIDAEGAGYYQNVTATVVGAGSDGSVVINTETGQSGGNSLARQFSKPVTLVDGFTAGDLRTYLTVSKPASSNVNVYYRVKNPLDPETIYDKDWTKMSQQTSIYTKSINLEKIELEFRPSTTSNNVIYSTDSATYSTFNQYQIKIVLNSSSTAATKIPYVHDARTIALPADEF